MRTKLVLYRRDVTSTWPSFMWVKSSLENEHTLITKHVQDTMFVLSLKIKVFWACLFRFSVTLDIVCASCLFHSAGWLAFTIGIRLRSLLQFVESRDIVCLKIWAFHCSWQILSFSLHCIISCLWFECVFCNSYSLFAPQGDLAKKKIYPTLWWGNYNG